jgi:hypothetical protein
MVTRVTRSDGSETVIDGWYIDVPGVPQWKDGTGGSIVVSMRDALPRLRTEEKDSVLTRRTGTG